MIAFVRGVMRAATSAGSRFSVTGSMSANTGVAPDAGDRLGGRVERERGADHLVAGADAHRLEREHERVGAVGDADRMRHVEVRGRLALERLDLGPEDEAARLEHLGEALLELRDERRVLRLDVDERNHDDPSVPGRARASSPGCREKRRSRATSEPHVRLVTGAHAACARIASRASRRRRRSRRR